MMRTLKIKFFSIYIAIYSFCVQPAFSYESAYDEIAQITTRITEHRKTSNYSSIEQTDVDSISQILSGQKYGINTKVRANDQERDKAWRGILTQHLVAKHGEKKLTPEEALLKFCEESLSNQQDKEIIHHTLAVVTMHFAAYWMVKQPTSLFWDLSMLKTHILSEIRKQCQMVNPLTNFLRSNAKHFNPLNETYLQRLFSPNYLQAALELTKDYQDVEEQPTIKAYTAYVTQNTTQQSWQEAIKKEGFIKIGDCTSLNGLLINSGPIPLIQKHFRKEDIKLVSSDHTLIVESASLPNMTRNFLKEFQSNPEQAKVQQRAPRAIQEVERGAQKIGQVRNQFQPTAGDLDKLKEAATEACTVFEKAKEAGWTLEFTPPTAFQDLKKIKQGIFTNINIDFQVTATKEKTEYSYQDTRVTANTSFTYSITKTSQPISIRYGFFWQWEYPSFFFDLLTSFEQQIKHYSLPIFGNSHSSYSSQSNEYSSQSGSMTHFNFPSFGFRF